MKQNRNFKKIALLAFVSLYASVSVFAQPKREKNEELHKEMRAYFEENILPVMKDQREKLDLILSTSEKQEVEVLREKAKAMREERQVKMEEMRENGRPERGDISPEQRAKMRSKMREHRQLMNQAWAILDNHATEVDALHETTAGQKEKWHEDMRAIKEKHLGEREKGQGRMGGKRGGKGHSGMRPGGGMGHGGPRGKGHGRPEHGMMGKAMFSGPMFLLWNPNDPLPFDRFEQKGNFDRAMVFPNPATNTVAIEYSLQNAGDVKITLHNRSGELVETILDANQSAGDFTQEISVENLASGMYFYKITTTEGTVTKRMVKR